MAKAKTSTKRTTASSSKKSSGKGLSKRLNLQSRKVQFFVFIFVVAILGGGWFTYKSFASNADVFNVGNGGIIKSHGTAYPVKDVTKGGAEVFTVGSGSRVHISKPITDYWGYKVQVCAMMKRNGNASSSFTYAELTTRSGFIARFDKLSTEWTEYCSTPTIINTSTLSRNATHKPDIYAGSGNVWVSYVTVQKISYAGDGPGGGTGGCAKNGC